MRGKMRGRFDFQIIVSEAFFPSENMVKMTVKRSLLRMKDVLPSASWMALIGMNLYKIET